MSPLELVRERDLVPVADHPSLRGPGITKGDTFNTRTGRPERGGLLCARVFGPTHTDRCNCGKYDGLEHRGVTCEKCGVEVCDASVRAERFGFVELAVPVIHPWLVEEVARELDVLAESLLTVGAWEDTSLLARLSDRMMVKVPLLPPDLRGGSWKERDPARTSALTTIFEAERRKSPFDRRFLDELVLRAHTHEFVPGGTNRRYARLVMQNERLRDFRRKEAPRLILLVEAAQLFHAVADVLGGNRWASADRPRAPGSIAGRLALAASEEEIAKLLFAAGFAAR